MHVDDTLEPWPEEHVCAVDIAVNSWHFAALQLKSEVLVQPNAGKDAKGIHTLLDKLSRECMSQVQRWLEDLVESAIGGVEGLFGEEFRQEGVLCRSIVYECEVECSEWNLEVMCTLIFFCKI
jgi:hypothetical protein